MSGPVSLVKVFRLFRLERTFLVFGVYGLSWGQSEPAPTSGPTWMDGVLIGLSFLSLSHPRLTFFVCLFCPDLSFFLQLYFLITSHLFSFFFCFWNFFHPLTHYPPLSPTDLLTYIFELIVNSSPSTYSPINLKCVTLIPTYMVTPTYMVATTIDPQRSDNNEERIKWQYCMELALVHSNKINKRTIKELTSLYKGIASSA